VEGGEQRRVTWVFFPRARENCTLTTAATLRLGFCGANAYIHLVGIKLSYGSNDPQRTKPKEEDGEGAPPPERAAPSLDATDIEDLKECLASIHQLFEIFLSLGVDVMPTIPSHNLFRVACGLIFLISLHTSASVPDSDIGKAINPADMKAGEYLNRLLEYLQRAISGGKPRSLERAAMVLKTLRAWFEGRQSQQNQDEVAQKPRVNAQPMDIESGATQPSYSQIRVQAEDIRTRITPAKPQQPTAHKQQPATQEPLAPQMGNTPLHFLSEVAAGHTSHSTPTPRANNEGWTPSVSGNDDLSTSTSLQQMPQQNGLPYSNEAQAYFHTKPYDIFYPDPLYQDSGLGYGAMGLDQSIEQAMGIFGIEGDMTWGLPDNMFSPVQLGEIGAGNWTWDTGQ
jgi:hypothetical protein